MPELSNGYKELLLAVAVPALYFVLLVLGRQLKRRHGVRLGFLYHLFALSLAVYLPSLWLRLQWPFLRHLGAAVVVLTATFVTSLVNRYVWEIHFQQRHGVKVPKFLTQVAGLLIILVAVFLVLEFAYDQTIKGLLIAPGMAAVVLGLAMQDTVGNIVAGLALQGGKSLVHGDWLFVDNRFAEVIEINWRSTRLRTVDHLSIEIPNREIARQTIINLNRPERLHAMRVAITLDFSAPPTRVKDVLLHATNNAKGVAAEPRPSVFLKNFGEYGIEYEIKFWMEDYSQYFDICDAIRTNVWYGLRRHGIRIPFPTRTVQLERPARDKQAEVQTAARIMLRQHHLFRCLSDDQLDALLPRGRAVHFGRGEKLIQQGDQGESMFILVDGEANVVRESNGGTTHLASLASGDCFGEMSLLTGEPRTATVMAHTDCEVVEIGKPVLAKSLKMHPQLLTDLSDLLAHRQMETEGILAADRNSAAGDSRQKIYAAGFVRKLKGFFQL